MAAAPSEQLSEFRGKSPASLAVIESYGHRNNWRASVLAEQNNSKLIEQS